MSATDHHFARGTRHSARGTRQQTDRKKISQLVFDRKNPRLALELIGGNSPDDGQIIRYLDDISPLSELVTSILENGYIAIEPLIVIKEGDVYRVLEGNRRLAAIKFIADKEFREEHDLFSIDESLITEHVRETIEEIPVYEVDDEKDARALIGFKHIKGPYKWNSFAKAKYVTDQYRENYSLDDPISAIAKKIGDENGTVRNLIGGMLVLEQALERGIFDTTDREKKGPFAFSHLYTALGRSEYQEYLGLKKGWLEKPNLSPISEENEENLKHILTYLYGSKQEGKRSFIRSQNPDLKWLGEVVVHPEAHQQLKATNSLDMAYEYLQPDDVVFGSSIRKALVAVDKVSSYLSRYNGEDESILDLAEKLLRAATQIERTIKEENKTYRSKQPEKQSWKKE